MASTQFERKMGEEELNHEEKASLDKLIQQAEMMCSSEDIVNRSATVVANHEGGAFHYGLANTKHRNHVDDDDVQLCGRNHEGYGQYENVGLGPIGAGLAIGQLTKFIIVIAGTLTSQTKGPLGVYATKKWAGHIVINCPNPLGSLGGFAMSAMTAKGVKAAVVYTGKNRANTDCGWLLAWSHTKAGGKRIYGECGPKSKFNNVNWGQIERKLDAAGCLAKCSDKQTGTSICATLAGAVGKDLLGAAFTG